MIQRDNGSAEECQFPAELQGLLSAYRSSVPEQDPSVNFMPELWGKIDSRRRLTHSFRRLAAVFVTGAAAICLVFSAALVQDQNLGQSVAAQSTYVDVLADDVADEIEMVAEHSESI